MFMVFRKDLSRAMLSWKMAVSILLGTAVCYHAVSFYAYQVDTAYKFMLLHTRSQSFLAYIAGVLPFASCIYDDFKENSIRNVLGRIPARRYFLSKMLAGLVSTITAFVLGKILFVLLYSIRSPMIEDSTFDMIKNVPYVDLLRQGHWLGYFLLVSFQMSLYCAMMCLLVMDVSMLVPNKAAMYAVPVMFFYIFNFYINHLKFAPAINMTQFFDAIWGKEIGGSDVMFMVRAVLVAALFYVFLFHVGYYILKRKIFQ